MTSRDRVTAGRGARRWWLFLLFFHLLPMPWFLLVAAGLAPTAFLMAGGLASLYNSDPDSLTFAVLLLAPALGGALVCTLLAFLVVAGIGLFRSPWVRTVLLLAVALLLVGLTMQPVYIAGGHGSSDSYTLLDFLDVLGEFRVPTAAALGYFATLGALLALLLIYQHAPRRFPFLQLEPRQRRRLERGALLAGVLLLAGSLLWTHRLLVLVYPFATAGFAPAQYHLAMALQAQAGRGAVGGVAGRGWLERAAEQGHVEAALALALMPMSSEDRLRWLTLAAEGGAPEAQYKLYRHLLRGSPDRQWEDAALDWLQRSAEGGSAEGRYELGRLLSQGSKRLAVQQDPEEARRWWELAAGQEHGRAMEQVARRLEHGSDGFPHDPERAAALLRKVAEGYREGMYGLPENARMADGSASRAEAIVDLERRVQAGDPEALATLGRRLLSATGATSEGQAEGLSLLERAAEHGDVELLYELGALFMFGNHGLAKDFDRGRPWWDRAAERGHVRTMSYLAPAHRNGQYGYPVDLLRAKALTERLAVAYRDGVGVEADPERASYWARELKHFDRLFEQAGGDYQPLEGLRSEATANDPAAQYQLGRQLLLSGAKADRDAGLHWIQRAADNGLAEAQYRLVTYYESRAHVMRDDPARGVAYLQAAADQRHLQAIGVLALAYHKGRHGLAVDLRQAVDRYREALVVHESGDYLGEVDERFVAFNRRQLGYAEKALAVQERREARWEQAAPLEREIIAIEDRYRQEYERAVNALDRSDGSREGKQRFREEVERLRLHFLELRQREIDTLKARG